LWVFLLLLLGAAAWSMPASWNTWALPVIAALALAACLFFRALSLRLWVAGMALLGLIALYALNPTHRWMEGTGLLPVAHIPGIPGSAFPAGGWVALGLATALFASYALAFQLSERKVGWLQVAATVGAVAMALAVLVQRLEPKQYPVYECTGIFVNENHFSVFANLILPVVLAMASRARIDALQAGRPSSPAGFFMMASFLLVIAVVLSHSRAGLAVTALVVIGYVVLAHRLARRHPFVGLPMSTGIKLVGGLMGLVVAGLAIRAFAREWHHLGDPWRELAFRASILKDVLATWWDRPVWGIGPGTFSVVFPYYQSAAFQGHTILHAHCEPMQFLAEFGLAGGLWVALAAGLALTAKGGRAPANPERIPSFVELERPAFALGLLACALQCIADFPLRIPLIALLAATWAGVWAGHRTACAKAGAGG
jgi:O-antigen ligase